MTATQTQLNFSRTKPPTQRDLKILAWMQAGNDMHGLLALDQFGCMSLRDCIYRLRKAGHPIQSTTIIYKTWEGKTKRYERYFIKK